MSKNNINDFFSKQNKSKPSQKKADAKLANDASQAQANQDQKPLKDAKKKLDYESSEEEKTELDLGDSQAIIKNKADIDAANRKRQQEENDHTGWKALENQRQDFTSSSSRGGPMGAQPKGAASNDGKKEISFGKRPPTFNKKSTAKKLDEDFPELGSDIKTSNKGDNLPEGVSKKDMANIGSFGQGGTEKRAPIDGQPPRETREPREERQFDNRREFTRQEQSDKPEEERKVASKPVFTSSKKKPLIGGDNVEEIQQSKQNYDFSSMQRSEATNKVSKAPEGGEENQDGKPKTYGSSYSNARRFDANDENDFTVVKEKTREFKPRRE